MALASQLLTGLNLVWGLQNHFTLQLLSVNMALASTLPGCFNLVLRLTDLLYFAVTVCECGFSQPLLGRFDLVSDLQNHFNRITLLCSHCV